MTFAGHGAFVVGPVITGALADAWSLRTALGGLVVGALGITVVAWWMPRKE